MVGDYRAFLRADVAIHKGERGYQKRLAEAAGCTSSYLSQVLHSHIHLTPDQAVSLAGFWQFTEDRTELFLCLVQRERASSKKFKEFLEKRIKGLRERHRRIAERVSAEQRVTSVDDRAAYYANWYMPALHILTSIDAYQTLDALVGRLQISKSLAQERLDRLVGMGFVQLVGGRYNSVVRDIHVESTSPMSISNHFQWRHRAMSRIADGDDRNLHYTAIHALSRKDIELLREMALAFIQRTREVVEPSKEEEAVGICCDLFYL